MEVSGEPEANMSSDLLIHVVDNTEEPDGQRDLALENSAQENPAQEGATIAALKNETKIDKNIKHTTAFSKHENETKSLLTNPVAVQLFNPYTMSKVPPIAILVDGQETRLTPLSDSSMTQDEPLNANEDGSPQAKRTRTDSDNDVTVDKEPIPNVLVIENCPNRTEAPVFANPIIGESSGQDVTLVSEEQATPIIFQIAGRPNDLTPQLVQFNPVVAAGDNTPTSIPKRTKPNLSTVKELTTGTPNPGKVGKCFKCELCSATFDRMGNYTRHRMVHTVYVKDDYRYKCKECERMFLQQCDLKRHETIHRGMEPFRCTVCNKGYIRRSDLRIHMKFHNKQKDFHCDQCSKSFYQNGDLKRHIRLVHLQCKVLTCGHCSKKYAKEATLIRHMQTQHRDIILKSLLQELKGEKDGDVSLSDLNAVSQQADSVAIDVETSAGISKITLDLPPDLNLLLQGSSTPLIVSMPTTSLVSLITNANAPLVNTGSMQRVNTTLTPATQTLPSLLIEVPNQTEGGVINVVEQVSQTPTIVQPISNSHNVEQPISETQSVVQPITDSQNVTEQISETQNLVQQIANSQSLVQPIPDTQNEVQNNSESKSIEQHVNISDIQNIVVEQHHTNKQKEDTPVAMATNSDLNPSLTTFKASIWEDQSGENEVEEHLF
ncbi:unnamed protein product [Owenia fusiformis]|uniref:Uncharacterized protein n=1 Tax=Owenia fusiformis TaxID=6347 RepID=A0A8J1T5L0_OWEFU|nr:unnamed protein product [Owenia fusiformis]